MHVPMTKLEGSLVQSVQTVNRLRIIRTNIKKKSAATLGQQLSVLLHFTNLKQLFSISQYIYFFKF